MNWKDDENDDYRSSENPCPFCDGELKIRRYYEDGYLVETNSSCSCGYNYNWSYGSVEIDYPEGYDEDGEKIVEDEE